MDQTNSEMIATILRILTELVHVLAPLFPQNNVTNNMSTELSQARDSAEDTAMPNVVQPNLYGDRFLPKVLPEARAAFTAKGTNSTPSAYLRLLALVCRFKKGANGNADSNLQNEANIQGYNILKSLARKIHSLLIDDISQKQSNSTGQCVLPLWSKVPKSTKLKYAYMLENTASKHGFPLYQCDDAWAALLLLFEAHKHKPSAARRNSQRSPDISNDPSTNTCATSGIYNETATNNFINLNSGNDSNDPGLGEDELSNFVRRSPVAGPSTAAHLSPVSCPSPLSPSRFDVSSPSLADSDSSPLLSAAPSPPKTKNTRKTRKQQQKKSNKGKGKAKK